MAAQKNPQAEPQAESAVKSAKTDNGRVRIIIRSDGSPMGNTDVFCSDGQGKQFLIKRDTEVDVPIGVLETLKDAIEEIQVTDAAGSVIGVRQGARFNIQVLS